MQKTIKTALVACVLAFAAPLAAEEFVARDDAFQAGDTFRDCPECPEMVVVPAGEFFMGSPENEIGHSHPQEDPYHKVFVRQPYAIGKYEVTFDEWDACVADGGCGGYRPNDVGWGRGSRPVIFISFEDAVAYTKWLSRKTGASYRLPSEAEWEYAARGGTMTPFHFGMTLNKDQAAFGAHVIHGPRNHTMPVGSFPPNAFGLHDVHGNVAEWTEDCWNPNYFSGPHHTNAMSNGDCRQRVTRGGSWQYSADYARSAARAPTYAAKGSGKDMNGFRVVRSLPLREPDLEAGIKAFEIGDYAQAQREFEPLAAQGDAVAQFYLGGMYLNGLGVVPGHTEAYQWLRKSADQDHADALYLVGYMYAEGLGLLKSTEEAIKWWRRAAGQGHIDAQYEIGYRYAEAVGVARDFAEAAKWWRMAAERGHASAQFGLGLLYINGDGVARNTRAAKEWWDKAANQGLAEAQTTLGVMYYNGDGVVRDLTIAYMWFDLAVSQGYREAAGHLDDVAALMTDAQIGEARELVAAWLNRSGDETVESLRLGPHEAAEAANEMVTRFEDGEKAFARGRYTEALRLWRPLADQGYAVAQFMIGNLYADGLGVGQDYSEAAKWFRMAAESGIAEAQVNLGLFYEQGLGVPRDYAAAAELYRKAADLGFADAYFFLGNMYADGLGVTKDLVEAARLFRKAAEKGVAEAQHNLALHYLLGDGVRQDFTEAATWMRKAAEAGIADAQANIGIMYLQGDGVPRDVDMAVTWLRKAAEQGNPETQVDLGILFSEGKDLAQDNAEAVKWFRRSADQGFALGQVGLGLSYATGEGVGRDNVLAYMWFELAAGQKSESAAKARKIALETQRALAGDMTPRQIAKAEKMARQWRPVPESEPEANPVVDDTPPEASSVVDETPPDTASSPSGEEETQKFDPSARPTR